MTRCLEGGGQGWFLAHCGHLLNLSLKLIQALNCCNSNNNWGGEGEVKAGEQPKATSTLERESEGVLHTEIFKVQLLIFINTNTLRGVLPFI